ncbi:DUF2254 domain-containing protein [Litchfieldia alkalitelluris]|uniref:DUF2254 domain-containing protein n=1 Tax=Litchfieldia alkalitelluris TaxID=304268 RepID=UPI001473E2C9|nr:DUF2254 domain-containing protein [Litchfieldia alkalitelluris]
MLKQFYQKLKNFIWLSPTLYSIGAFILAVSMILIDHAFFQDSADFFPEVLLVEVELAQEVLGVIAGSLLTMTTITFSITMVVLTTFSSQFSPRVLQNFIRDSITVRVLGVFVSGFVYSIFSLLFMQKNTVENHVVTASIGVLIATICIGFFIYFIHHVASWVQVSNLIDLLSKDVIETINSRLNILENNDYTSLSSVKIPIAKESSKVIEVKNERFGYLQFINEEELYDLAKNNGYRIEVMPLVGSFLPENETVMRVFHPNSDHALLKEMFTVGPSKTANQDIEFGIQKITEIALRAVSPGINDPDTAIECIQHLGMCLKKVSKYDGVSLVYKHDGKVVMSIPQKPFEDLLKAALYQVSHYAQKDISIITVILEILCEIAEDTTWQIKQKVSQFSKYVVEKINHQSLTDYDKELLLIHQRRLQSIVGD